MRYFLATTGNHAYNSQVFKAFIQHFGRICMFQIVIAEKTEKTKSTRIQLKLTFSVTYEDTLVTGGLVDMSSLGIYFISKFKFAKDSSLFM